MTSPPFVLLLDYGPRMNRPAAERLSRLRRCEILHGACQDVPVGFEPSDVLSLGRLPRILRDLVEADRSVPRDDVASAKTTTPKAERAMGCG